MVVKRYFKWNYKSTIGLLLILGLSINAYAQKSRVTLTGKVLENETEIPLPYVSVLLLSQEGELIEGTVTDEKGIFAIGRLKSGKYKLEISYLGYRTYSDGLFIGSQSDFLNIGNLYLEEEVDALEEVYIRTKSNSVSQKLDKKTFSISQNISQAGGSVLDALKNLPGVSTQEGKLTLRGSDKVVVLIDGKQSALTGFDGQEGLDNFPTSNIDRIEVINNPSAKHGAAGSAGVINIITKKENKNGIHGKVGISGGLGSLWKRKSNLPGVRKQPLFTPKANPSVFLNYRKDKINLFTQIDDYYVENMSDNDFADRYYANSATVKQQKVRLKTSNFFNAKSGFDWFMDEHNTLTIAASFTNRSKTHNGNQGFYNEDLSERRRLWNMAEDERNTIATGSVDYTHQFINPGHSLNAIVDYAFTRKHKDYDFENILENSTGFDAFKLVFDEKVFNLKLDYTRPLKWGKLETGMQMRFREIPSNMNLIPGVNSVIDPRLGGESRYKELNPSWYGNYFYESEQWEAEIGLRLENLKVDYNINPDHQIYKSDRFEYGKAFVNSRLGYKIDQRNTLSLFYNSRMDPPGERDLRIYPKYHDAELLEIGNPTLVPQFSKTYEVGYRTRWNSGSFYGALYHKRTKNSIALISTTDVQNDWIYTIKQNTGNQQYSGVELLWSQSIGSWYDLEINTHFYRHHIGAFEGENQYPVPQYYSNSAKSNNSGDLKMIHDFNWGKSFSLQVTGLYLAREYDAQTSTAQRFSLDAGFKKSMQGGKGAFFLNVTDLLNTMAVKKTVVGVDFTYTTRSYAETQVVRLGYHYKF